MKKMVVMLMVLGAVAAGCYDREENGAGAPAPPEADEANTVTIQGFAFNPETLVINKGETVVWTNMDGVRHTVTSAEGDKLNSDPLARMETYSHTFDEPGEFDYFCAPHPRMTGRIIVEDD